MLWIGVINFSICSYVLHSVRLQESSNNIPYSFSDSCVPLFFLWFLSDLGGSNWFILKIKQLHASLINYIQCVSELETQKLVQKLELNSACR